MYTNMEIDELITGVELTLPEKVAHPQLNAVIDRKEVLALLELALKNNHFTFQDELYTQVIGAAMGAVMSPEICDIRLHQHMNDIIKKSNINHKLLLHVRFRDDGFMIFTDTEDEEIDQFFTIANEAHPLLKFTHTKSDQETTFLDTEVYKGPRLSKTGTLDIRSHVKPTETYQFLERSSCHPEQVFSGFMKGRMITFIRNNSQASTLKEISDIYREKLSQRGYKPKEIAKATQESNFPEREKALEERKKSTEKPLVFVTKYDPEITNLNTLLTKSWSIIAKKPGLNKLFPSKPTIAYARHSNLQECLKRKTAEKPEETPPPKRAHRWLPRP
jgi:hypothetical protein